MLRAQFCYIYLSLRLLIQVVIGHNLVTVRLDMEVGQLARQLDLRLFEPLSFLCLCKELHSTFLKLGLLTLLI